jgi:membrane protein involved in colicin uptake
MRQVRHIIFERTPMNPRPISLVAAVTLTALLSACDKSPPAAQSGAAEGNAIEPAKVAAIDPKPVSEETTGNDSSDLAAASERMRQTSMKIREDIEKMRESRNRLEAAQEAERKQAAEQAQQKAIDDAAELSSAKGDKQRQSLEAAQTQSRKEAAAKAEQAERERQAALAAQKAKEEQVAQAERERQAALTAQRAKEEAAATQLAAKARAAEALKAALQSAGPKAYE